MSTYSSQEQMDLFLSEAHLFRKILQYNDSEASYINNVSDVYSEALIKRLLCMFLYEIGEMAENASDDYPNLEEFVKVVLEFDKYYHSLFARSSNLVNVALRWTRVKETVPTPFIPPDKYLNLLRSPEDDVDLKILHAYNESRLVYEIASRSKLPTEEVILSTLMASELKDFSLAPLFKSLDDDNVKIIKDNLEKFANSLDTLHKSYVMFHLSQVSHSEVSPEK